MPERGLSQASESNRGQEWKAARVVHVPWDEFQEAKSKVQAIIDKYDALVAEFASREKAVQRVGADYDFWQAHFKERAQKAEAELEVLREAAQAAVDAWWSATSPPHESQDPHPPMVALRAALGEKP